MNDYHQTEGQYQAPYQQPYAGGAQQYQQPYYQAQSAGQPVPARPQVKSGFWTFCFSFIPGAGQMYLGHSKRGLSLITLFCLGMCIGNMVYDLWFLPAIVWMFSFFDTYDLRSKMALGMAKPDDFVIPVRDNSFGALLQRRHSLVGWGLIVLGIWAIYDTLLYPYLSKLLENYGMNWLNDIFYRLPSLVLIVAIIALGIWLVHGPKADTAGTAPQEENIPHYNADIQPQQEGETTFDTLGAKDSDDAGAEQ